MTEIEYYLFKSACKWKARYERSNPDVGFGPFAETIIREVEREAGVVCDRIDPAFIQELNKILR